MIDYRERTTTAIKATISDLRDALDCLEDRDSPAQLMVSLIEASQNNSKAMMNAVFVGWDEPEEAALPGADTPDNAYPNH